MGQWRIVLLDLRSVKHMVRVEIGRQEVRIHTVGEVSYL